MSSRLQKQLEAGRAARHASEQPEQDENGPAGYDRHATRESCLAGGHQIAPMIIDDSPSALSYPGFSAAAHATET